jgi:hypothetical protein
MRDPDPVAKKFLQSDIHILFNCAIHKFVYSASADAEYYVLYI